MSRCFYNGRTNWIRTSEMTESKSVALPLGYSPKYIHSLESFSIVLNNFIKCKKKRRRMIAASLSAALHPISNLLVWRKNSAWSTLNSWLRWPSVSMIWNTRKLQISVDKIPQNENEVARSSLHFWIETRGRANIIPPEHRENESWFTIWKRCSKVTSNITDYR